MVLAEVTEMWVRVPEAETKGKPIAPLYKDRFVPRMGGDSITSILMVGEQTPQVDDSKTAATHKNRSLRRHTRPA